MVGFETIPRSFKLVLLTLYFVRFAHGNQPALFVRTFRRVVDGVRRSGTDPSLTKFGLHLMEGSTYPWGPTRFDRGSRREDYNFFQCSSNKNAFFSAHMIFTCAVSSLLLPSPLGTIEQPYWTPTGTEGWILETTPIHLTIPEIHTSIGLAVRLIISEWPGRGPRTKFRL